MPISSIVAVVSGWWNGVRKWRKRNGVHIVNGLIGGNLFPDLVTRTRVFLLSAWRQAHMVPIVLGANLPVMPQVISFTGHSIWLDLPLNRFPNYAMMA
jgi:hypothetical protein